MAGRRQEARLAEIGLLGQHLRLREFLVHPQQFGRAPRDPLFQRFVGALQLDVGKHARGDVGIGCDDAAVRHGVRTDFEGAAAGLQLDLPGAGEGVEAFERQPFRALLDVAAPRQMFEHLGERHADLSEFVGQVEQQTVLPVPADQPEVPVED